ncbi:MAG: translin family protein [Thermoplasmatota archaeon]
MVDIGNLEEIIGEIDNQLNDKDTVRELALKSSRAIRRLSRRIIKEIHNNKDPQETFKEALQEVSKIKSIIEDYPELFHAGFLRNGFQELAEAHLLWSISDEEVSFKKPEELGITPSSYLVGLGDLIGELRRMTLDELTEGNIEEAEELLDKMETIKDMLNEFDYPQAIVPLKNKQDIARSLVEKTRGDIAISSRNEMLKDKIDELLEEL